jgi:hypothetical protein
MGRLSKHIGDRRVLGLIRRYLGAGILVHGLRAERHEGTPQGGPLSPLLANVLLDEVWTNSWRNAGTPSCATSMRQRVRAVAAGWRARDGPASADLRGTPTASQRDEKRGGLGVEPEASGLPILGGTRADGETSGGGQSLGHDEGVRPSHHEAVRWAKHRTGVQATWRVPARVEGIFPPGGYAPPLR